MNEELNQTRNEPSTTQPGVTARPGYRTAETEEGISLTVALPGVRKDDLTVTFHEGILTLEGTRRDDVPADWKPVQAPARPDRYRLRMRLHSSLDPNRTVARLEDGLLRLDISKREEALPRRIDVN